MKKGMLVGEWEQLAVKVANASDSKVNNQKCFFEKKIYIFIQKHIILFKRML
jgi:hypothetical protein